jgi:hypothetical protein
MYDEDYEDWVQEQIDAEVGKQVREGKYTDKIPTGKFAHDAAAPDMRGFITKDSGKRFESPDGMVRDTSEGKPQFTLLFPKDVPFEDQLMTRVADLYHRGGVKYGARNWEKSSTEEALAKHEDCLMRHVIKFLLGVEDGEDHAAAVVWNVNAVDLTRRKIREKKQAHLDAFGGLETKPHNHNPLDFKAGSYSGPDCGCGKNLPDEAPPFNPDLSLIGHVTKGQKAKPFPTVEFSHGDEVLDKNYYRWQYSTPDMTWYCTTMRSNYPSVGQLANANGPLMFQDGAYAGITMLRDGSLRWG